MICSLSLNSIFEILQNKKFEVGNATLLSILEQIESKNETRIKLSISLKKQLKTRCQTLKNKWKQLKGGLQRSEFLKSLINKTFDLEVFESDIENPTMLDFGEQHKYYKDSTTEEKMEMRKFLCEKYSKSTSDLDSLGLYVKKVFLAPFVLGCAENKPNISLRVIDLEKKYNHLILTKRQRLNEKKNKKCVQE